MSATRVDPRPVIQVACGVLMRGTREILLAQRPAGKLAAGKWEFPGGKIEAGESPRDALEREILEELGTRVISAEPLVRIRQDYSDRRVWLYVWRVTEFAAEPEGLEGQQVAWIFPESLPAFDVLPSCWRVSAALRLPRHYVFSPAQAEPEAIFQGISRLPTGALLRLRLPGLADADYEAVAIRSLEIARTVGVQVILDRDPRQAEDLKAAGWHASAGRLSSLTERPVSRSRWFLGSSHDRAELARAHRLDVDAVVLGPVLATKSHPGADELGWSRFSALAQEAGLPVFAIGGTGPAEVDVATTHGASGVAGISAYWS